MPEVPQRDVGAANDLHAPATVRIDGERIDYTVGLATDDEWLSLLSIAWLDRRF